MRGSNLRNNGVSWATGSKILLLTALDLLYDFCHRTAACLALTGAFGMTRLRRFRLEVCEPHWHVVHK
jgi:hypothetical protein